MIGTYGNADGATLHVMKKLLESNGNRADYFETLLMVDNYLPGFMLRAVYHTPLKYFMTTPVEKSAGRLTRLAVGVPGADFEPGMAYSDQDRFIVWCEDHIDAWGRDLWEQCEGILV